MEQAPLTLLIPANLLSRWTSMEHVVTITCISFASRRDGSVDQCRTQAVLTLDCHCMDSWVYPRAPIVSVNSLTGKEVSNVVCLSMPELMHFLDRLDEQEQSFGSVQRALTSALTTLIRTRGTGFDEPMYSTMQYSGESISTALLLEPLGLIELLRYLTICLRWSIKPSSLDYEPISETSHTIVSKSGTMVTILGSELGQSPGCMIFHKLLSLYSGI